MFDNKIFKINGSGSEMLENALELAFMQHGRNTTCEAWSQSNRHGLVLHWHNNSPNAISLPSPLSAKECLPIAEVWLRNDFTKSVELDEWCNNLDHDGHNKLGWLVYCEDWGHVGGTSSAICAIKPCYLWLGK